MTDIQPILQRLGLDQYCNAFLAEGFDTWETVLDIQENDLYVFRRSQGCDKANRLLGRLLTLSLAIGE